MLFLFAAIDREDKLCYNNDTSGIGGMLVEKTVLLTKNKIMQDLGQQVKHRIKGDLIVGAFMIFSLIFGAIILYSLHANQAPAAMILVCVLGVLLLYYLVWGIVELITLGRMKKRIHARRFSIIRDTLVCANENMRPIDNEIIMDVRHSGKGPQPRKDEYIFESGMRYVRNSNEPDAFGLRGIMQYADDPIPFFIQLSPHI